MSRGDDGKQFHVFGALAQLNSRFVRLCDKNGPFVSSGQIESSELLRKQIEASELMREIMEAKTHRMQWLIGFLLGGLVIAHVVCGYLKIPSPLNGSQGWAFASIAAMVLVGYLSQIAMMLGRNLKIITKISNAGAQLDAAVTPDRAVRGVTNRGSPGVQKS